MSARLPEKVLSVLCDPEDDERKNEKRKRCEEEKSEKSEKRAKKEAKKSEKRAKKEAKKKRSKTERPRFGTISE